MNAVSACAQKIIRHGFSFYIRQRRTVIRQNQRDTVFHVCKRHKNLVARFQDDIAGKIAFVKNFETVYVGGVAAPNHPDIVVSPLRQNIADQFQKPSQAGLRFHKDLPHLRHGTHDIHNHLFHLRQLHKAIFRIVAVGDHF